MGIKAKSILGAALACLVSGGAWAESSYLDLSPVAIPNFVGIGIGGVPDYIGSDNYMGGAVPFGRYSWGNRYIDLQGNFVSINVIDHPYWRLGPAAMLRFGRQDVDDSVVGLLPEIGHSLDLGGFVNYEISDRPDPRDRLVFGADFVHDVSDEHSGYTISASMRKWFPVGNFAAFGLSVATTYGSQDYMDTYFSITPAGSAVSGLAPFEAEAGFRDVRITALAVQPLSKQWVVGAGAMYMHLVGDASDTPLTKDRGSDQQVIFGLGLARMF